MQNTKCKIQNAKYKMQNAKCKMQDARCKMQVARCKLQYTSCKMQVLAQAVSFAVGCHLSGRLAMTFVAIISINIFFIIEHS